MEFEGPACGDICQAVIEMMPSRLAGGALCARRSAVNRSPSLERFIFAGFPVRQFGHDYNARLDVEAERSSVLKANVDDAFVGRNKEFYCLDYLAIHFGKFHLLHDSHFRQSVGSNR